MSAAEDASKPVDPRRALGRRPGQPPRLFIDEPPLEDLPPSPTFPSWAPPSPSSRNVSLNIPVASAEAGPSSPQSLNSPNTRKFRRPTIKTKSTPKVSLRGLYETQKLLSHLLDRLEARDAAPDLLARAAISARNVNGRSKGKGKGKTGRIGQAVVAAAQNGLHSAQGSQPRGQQPLLAGIASEDLEDRLVLGEGEWDTDATCDLVEQTRSLLVLAHKQGLDLFSSTDDGPTPSTSPVRTTRRKTGRFASLSPSSSTKPAFDDKSMSDTASTVTSISGDTLLQRMISILGNLVDTDCMHRTHLFRPFRPPHALQSACLDIASYVYHACGTTVKVRLIEIVTGGFYTMGAGMTERLCEWLEGRLGELLGRLARERGGVTREESTAWQDPFSQSRKADPSVPTFAFSAAPQDTSLSATSPGWMRYSPTSPSNPMFPPISASDDVHGILSTHASSAELSTLSLRLASLVPRLILAITTSVDMSSSKLTTLHRVHRLLSLILTAKPDTSLDLLDIVAYASAQARKTAVEILSTFYPDVMGHNVIARRPPSTAYTAQMTKWETGHDKVLGQDAAEDHHFVPWRISSREESSETASDCAVCHGDIHGFCIKCTLCDDVQHLHCYRGRDAGFQYDVKQPAGGHRQSAAIQVKFSRSQSRLSERTLDGANPRENSNSTRKKIGEHDMHMVNLFTTTLCAGCRLPLWGSSSQAYACMYGCQKLFHAACCERAVNNSGHLCKLDSKNPEFKIQLEDLSQSMRTELGYLCLTGDALTSKTYDEIAILYGSLWVSYQLLKNGISEGAIQVTTTTGEITEFDFTDIRGTLKAYEEQLRVRDIEASSAAADFAHVANSGQIPGQGYLFSKRYLTYCTALIRAPASTARPASPAPSEGYLTAQGIPAGPDHVHADDSGSSYEVLELTSIAQTLASDLDIRDPRLAALLIDQLRTIGLIACTSLTKIDHKALSRGVEQCTFTLPLLMDSSPTVEQLILSLENLLEDLDLTMNEIALRIMVNRAWPSLLCSPYALERLGGALIAWIMRQEHDLAEIIKLYASKHRRLPGVRGWDKGSSSVSTYKESREVLMSRYARGWLLALHDQDPALYAHIVYDQCKSLDALGIKPDVSADEAASQIAGRALERMTTVVDADLIFSAHLDLLTAWLEDLGALASKDIIYKSLPRLLRHLPSRCEDSVEQPDIWTLAHLTSIEGTEGLERVCKWMRVLSFSGVEVPWESLTSLVDLQVTEGISMEARRDLVIAVNSNAKWLDPNGLAPLCCRMFVDLVVELSKHGISGVANPNADVVKESLLMVLRAYGVALDDVATTCLAAPDMQAKQPASLSRRKRGMTSASLLPVDEDMVKAVGDLIKRGLYPVQTLLDFLWLLFTKSPYAANIDGFLYKNASDLFPILWDLYDQQVNRKSRARVFLRLLAVNAAPMEQIVKEQFHAGDRTLLKERLLRFVLEIADESLSYENLSWRRASVGLIILFFQALLDASDLNPDNLVILKALFPSHLLAVSACFEEYLVQSSDERRLGLMGRLHRLRLALPKWPVLSWRVIEEILGEMSVTIDQMTPAHTPQTISALNDALLVRANLIALGLDMLAAGIEIGWVTAQRFQQHTAMACALPWNQATEYISTLVLPAMRSVLDSPQHLHTSTQVADPKAKKTALIGAIFVPIAIEFARDLNDYAHGAQRSILDITMLIFFKQNTRHVELAALAALQSVAEYIARNDCVQTRLMGVQILSTAQERLERDSLARVAASVFGIVARSLVKESENSDGDTLLVEQMTAFLIATIRSFGRSRLFVQILRTDSADKPGDSTALARSMILLSDNLESGTNQAVKFSIPDLVIADLPDMFKRSRQTVEQVLEGFDRYASILVEALSEDAAIGFGAFLTRLGKHVGDWHADEFDPNTALSAAASLLALAPDATASTLLHQTSTLLHLCLLRFNVESAVIRRLIDVSDGASQAQHTEDTVRTVLFEVAGSSLQGYHVTPKTLQTLLCFIDQNAFGTSSKDGGVAVASQSTRLYVESAQGCLKFLLRNHPTLHGNAVDPAVYLAIAAHASSILLRAEDRRPRALTSRLAIVTDSAASSQLTVFTHLLLACTETGITNLRMFSLYPVVARAMSLCLRASADLLAVQDTAGDGAANLSTVFATFRLVMLAAQQSQNDQSAEPLVKSSTETVWARTWPDWYRLLSLSVEQNCVNGPLRAVTHSVFLDTIIFLGKIDSDILIQHSGPLIHALKVLHRYKGTSLQGGTRLVKAEEVIRQAGLHIARENQKDLLKIVKGDLLAAERLRSLRASS